MTVEEIIVKHEEDRRTHGKITKTFFWGLVREASFVDFVVYETNYENKYNQGATLLVVNSDNIDAIGAEFKVNMNTPFLKPLLVNRFSIEKGDILNVIFRSGELNSRVAFIQRVERDGKIIFRGN